jgi:hypothetical protein
MEISENIKLIVAGIVLGSCYIATFVMISKYIGSADKWGYIQDRPHGPAVWGMSIVGSIALFLAAYLYFQSNPEKIMYFIFTVTFLAVGLSYGALSIALINKN